MNEEVLAKVHDYIINCFQQDWLSYLCYHNLSHTQNVVARSQEIGDIYGLDEDSLFILLAAAWFHDLGQLYTSPEEHENLSVALMIKFLQPYCAPETLHEIKNAIDATRFSTQPKSILEEIICDADTYHFGTDEFLITDLQVKNEMEARTGKKFVKWEEQSIQLLKAHQFYTSYCKGLLNGGKEKNIAYLEQRK